MRLRLLLLLLLRLLKLLVFSPLFPCFFVMSVPWKCYLELILTQNKTVYPAVLYSCTFLSFIHLKHVYKHLFVRYIIFTHVYHSFTSSFPMITPAKPATHARNQGQINPAFQSHASMAGRREVSMFLLSKTNGASARSEKECELLAFGRWKYTSSSPFFRPALNFQLTQSGLRT